MSDRTSCSACADWGDPGNPMCLACGLSYRDRIEAEVLTRVMAAIEAESEQTGKDASAATDQDLREALEQRVIGYDLAWEIVDDMKGPNDDERK